MLTAEDREWLTGVEEKFVNAMAAAAVGEPIDWQVWPPTDPQAVIDQAATEYVCGYAEVMLDREPESYAISDPPPSTEELLDRLARHRIEHGPFLREVRCDSTVLTYLTLKLRESERKPWEPQPLGTPVFEDDEVPARVIRRVYDDGTSEDVEVMGEATYELIRSMPETLECKPWPVPNRFSDIYRYGAAALPPFSISNIITGV